MSIVLWDYTAFCFLMIRSHLIYQRMHHVDLRAKCILSECKEIQSSRGLGQACGLPALLGSIKLSCAVSSAHTLVQLPVSNSQGGHTSLCRYIKKLPTCVPGIRHDFLHTCAVLTFRFTGSSRRKMTLGLLQKEDTYSTGSNILNVSCRKQGQETI